MLDIDTNELLKCEGLNCGRSDHTAMRRSVVGITRVLCARCVAVMYPASHGWIKPDFTFVPPPQNAGKKKFGTFKR